MPKLFFIMMYSVHVLFDLLTLIFFIPTIPFRFMIKPVKGEDRVHYFHHYLIITNFMNLMMLLPRVTAFCVFPLVKRMNFREDPNLEDLD